MIEYEMLLLKKTKYSVFLITQETEVIKRSCKIFRTYRNTLISTLF